MFSRKKILPLDYPNISKSGPYLFSPLNEKQDYFWLFLQIFVCKNWGWSKVKGLESKSNIACAGIKNPGLLNVQKILSHHFPIFWLLVPNDVSEKFQPGFSSLAAFPGITPTFVKNKLHWIRQNLMLNQLAPIQNPKNEK